MLYCVLQAFDADGGGPLLKAEVTLFAESSDEEDTSAPGMAISWSQKEMIKIVKMAFSKRILIEMIEFYKETPSFIGWAQA